MSAKTTIEQEQRIIKLYQDGNTYEQISALENVAISTISRTIKKYDVKYKCKCGMCKNPFMPYSRSTKFCDECKPKAQAEYQKEYRASYNIKRKSDYIAKPKTERKKKHKVKSLEEVVTIMRERGISYADIQRMEG